VRPLLLGLAFLATVPAAPPGRTDGLLGEAIARTARGDLPGAESLYRSLAEEDPDSGLPALARFLALTAPPEAMDAFLARVRSDASRPPFLRARVFLLAGRDAEAADLLLPRLAPDAPPHELVFAADLAERSGRRDAALPLLLRALDSATTPEAARDPLRRLLPHAAPLAASRHDLAPVRRWLPESDLPAEDRLAFLDDLEARRAFSPGPPGSAPFDHLLASLSLARTGAPEAALARLPEPAPAEPDLFALHRLRLLARLGRTEESGPLARRLLGLPDSPPEPASGPPPEERPWTEADAIAHLLARPFDPEPMRALIRLRAAAGRPPQDIAAVPALVAEDATNPFFLGHCGYVLATEGFPEIALTYHDRALAREPGDPFLAMNRAACLTRLGRWDEAAAIYRSLLVHGHAGRPYHVHELILRLWQIASRQGTEAACRDMFTLLARDPSLPWRNQIAEESASLFSRLPP
jgi:tetratricopeptide (TPR) repeat protein